MTLKEFKKQVSGAPYDMLEVAQLAETVTDAPGLQKAGAEFRTWYEVLEQQLDTLSIELG